MRSRVSFPELALMGVLASSPALADAWAANAFPDATIQVSGPAWDTSSPTWTQNDYHCTGPGSVGNYLIETEQEQGLIDLSPDMVFELRFVNNSIVNGPGYDLAIYELAYPAAGGYRIAVPNGSGGFTEFKDYSATALGEDWGYAICGATHYLGLLPVYKVAVDLSDFGVANGASISAVRFSALNGADPVKVAAINSGPALATLPSTWGHVKSLYR